MERPNPEDDPSPQSLDGQAYDGPQSHYEEGAPKKVAPSPNHSMRIYPWMKKRKRRELPEDQRGAQALPLAPREVMGIKASPAAYVPQLPKYIRDSEDEGAQDLDSDEDIEAPYLAPRKKSNSEHTQQDMQAAQALLLMRKEEAKPKALVDYSSSDSVPDLVDSEGEVHNEDEDTEPQEQKKAKLPAVRPADLKIYPLTTMTTVVPAPPPQSSQAMPRRRPALTYNPEAYQKTEEIPAEEVICIDDEEEETAPTKQLTQHVDRILMPPPMDTTLVSRKTVPLPSQDPQTQKKKGLAPRRKGKPLKLKIHQVARMRTGPVDHERAHMMSQLTSAVVPLCRLQISEISEDTGVKVLPAPQEPEPTPETPNPQ